MRADLLASFINEGTEAGRTQLAERRLGKEITGLALELSRLDGNGGRGVRFAPRYSSSLHIIMAMISKALPVKTSRAGLSFPFYR